MALSGAYAGAVTGAFSGAHPLWSGAISLFPQILELSAGKPFFTLNLYDEDIVTGKVAAFLDWNDPEHMLAQSIDANQVDIPATHSDFAGNACGTFTGTQWYQSTDITKYNFAHDGTGMAIVPVFTRTNVSSFHALCASNLFGSTSHRGFGLAMQASGNAQAFVGSGTQAIWSTTTGGTTAINVPTYRDCSWDKTANAWAVRNKGTLAASGTTPNTPNVGNSVTAMALGSVGNGTFGFVGRIAAFPSFPYLDASGRAIVQQWIAAEYGIAP